jgi:Fe-S-cluster formation regulator IscX/YfhJ
MKGHKMKTRSVMMIVLLLSIFAGCQSPEPTRKDMFVLATRIAINHLEVEKALALEDCEEDDIEPANCEDAIDYQRWVTTLSKFESHLEDSNDIGLGAIEIDLISDAVIGEMGDDVDPRTVAYIHDIRIILKMLIREHNGKQ